MGHSVSVSAIRTLQECCERADSDWSSLHHATAHVGGGAQGLSPLRYFSRAVVESVILPLVGQQNLIYCEGAWMGTHEVFWSNSANDTDGLTLFNELSLAICRTLFGDEVIDFASANSHRIWWTDRWLGVLYDQGRERKDPILHSRRFDLAPGEKAREFRLVPGYAHPTPMGWATGALGRRRLWKKLIPEFIEVTICFFTLEQGLFRASAHALKQIATGEWGTLSTKFSPTAIDVAILKALSEASATLKQAPLTKKTCIDGGTLSRGTIGPRIKRLAKEGLVDYPHGARKGVAITPEGRRLLSECLRESEFLSSQTRP